MQPVMNVADIEEFEASLAERGLKAHDLMQRAGAVVALQVAQLVHDGSVVVLCGMGNNGGDGWVAADNLARHGYEVSVVCAATPAVMKSEVARRMAGRVVEMGIPVHVDPSFDDLSSMLAAADVVVDAVFGTGFSGSLPSPYDMWVRAVDERFSGTVVAVDVPSGINATTGMAEGPFFDADVTVTMFAMKPGLVSGQGRRASGSVAVASLAVDEGGLSDLSEAAAAFVLDEADYDGALPEADPLRDKYGRGRVLVVAGSVRYPGAAVLAATAAARSGAGYVTLAVPAPVVPVAQAHLLGVPVVGLPGDEEGSFGVEAADRIAGLAAKADAVLAGPGMTTSFGACEVVRRLLEQPCALVLDADALNALVKICTGSAEQHPDALRREHPLVLTPHRRELARLVGADPAQTASLAQAMRAAQGLAWAVGSADFCVVAKGAVTAVATIDGTVIPEPGPASLATAGTGDVLAGVEAGLLAQTLALRAPEEGIGSNDLLMLAAAADRVHAIAGHLAAAEHGSRGVLAPDVAAKVGLALDVLDERCARAAEGAPQDAGGRLEGDLAFEDESRIVPPPEMERLIRGDAAARGVKLPGELEGYAGELEEPAGASRPAPAVGPASDPVSPPVAGVPEQAGPACPDPAASPAAADAPAPHDGRRDDATAPDASGDVAGSAAAAAVPPFLAAPPRAAEAPVAAPEADASGGDAVRGAPAAEETEGDARPDGPALPPFLSRPPVAADATTVMAPVAADPAPQPQPTPGELERRRREAFHERATLHIDDDAVTPVDKRPSARVRRHR